MCAIVINLFLFFSWRNQSLSPAHLPIRLIDSFCLRLWLSGSLLFLRNVVCWTASIVWHFSRLHRGHCWPLLCSTSSFRDRGRYSVKIRRVYCEEVHSPLSTKVWFNIDAFTPSIGHDSRDNTTYSNRGRFIYYSVRVWLRQLGM